MQEIWKPVIGYEGLYEVSNFGNVKSLNYNRKKWLEKVLSPYNDRSYSSVVLSKNWIIKTLLTHRLVAVHFIPNPTNLPFVCHKDEKLINGFLYNWADNLFWWTQKDNMHDCMRKNRLSFIVNHPIKWRLWKENHLSKSVYQYSKELEFIKKWDCAMDIKRTIWLNQKNVSACCKWRMKTFWWFVWKHEPITIK